MTIKWPPVRLNELPINAKVLVSGFIIVLGLGFIAAYFFFYLHFEMADGEPGFALADVAAYFKDGRGPSRLERAVRGRMAAYFSNREEQKKVLAWARIPASKRITKEREYGPVRDIVDVDCIVCHGRGPGKKFPPLETYRDMVAASVPAERPVGAYELAGTTHTHLIALGALVSAVGFLFSFSGVRPWLGAIIVGLTYVGLVADVGGWWLATESASGAYLSAAGGALMGTMLAVQMIWSLAVTWFGKSERAQGA